MNWMFLAQAAGTKITTDAVNTLMSTSMSTLVNNFSDVSSMGYKILVALVGIEFAWLIVVGMGQRPSEFKEAMLKKLAVVCVISFLALNWGGIANQIRGYVAGAGGAAGGSSASSSNPSAIAQTGIDKVNKLFNKDDALEFARNFHTAGTQAKPNLSTTDMLLQTADGIIRGEDSSQPVLAMLAEQGETIGLMIASLLIYLTLALMIVLTHFYVAAMVFVYTIEFYIIVNITSVFIPFGVNKHLSYLTTNAINSVIAAGVKLGVVTMVLGLMGAPMANASLTDTPSLGQMFSMLMHSMLMMFIISKAPATAAAAFSGGGNGIDVGQAISQGMAQVAGSVAGGPAGGATMQTTMKSIEKATQSMEKSAKAIEKATGGGSGGSGGSSSSGRSGSRPTRSSGQSGQNIGTKSSSGSKPPKPTSGFSKGTSAGRSRNSAEGFSNRNRPSPSSSSPSKGNSSGEVTSKGGAPFVPSGKANAAGSFSSVGKAAGPFPAVSDAPGVDGAVGAANAGTGIKDAVSTTASVAASATGLKGDE